MGTIPHDSETPAHGQHVITTVAFIHHDFDGIQKVFLPKRATMKKFLPDVFELPGGHIDFGEDPVTGLKREIKEEFGMRLHVGDPFFVFTYLNEVKGSHSIEVVYFATFKGDISKIKLNAEDHSGYGWFAESELGKAFTDKKGESDEEFKVIKKGFGMLQGKTAVF